MSTGTPAEADAPEEKPKTRRRTTKKAEADAGAPSEDKPRSRRRTTKKSEADPGADAPAEDKPKSRRRTTKKSSADEGEVADEKPKARRRTSNASKKDEAGSASADAPAATDGGDAEGEPQGIWGRFRSARKGRETTTG